MVVHYLNLWSVRTYLIFCVDECLVSCDQSPNAFLVAILAEIKYTLRHLVSNKNSEYNYFYDCDFIIFPTRADANKPQPNTPLF
jgi:hypothetical protein